MNHITSLVCTLTTLSLLLTVPVQAQIEEIVVTAQKREQSIQDVGITVSAFDEETFRELGGSDISRIGDQIPAVVTYGTGTSIQAFHVRGIGLNEFAGNFDTPVAVHVDEVYISKNWMSVQPKFDIARLEVLKGPQGTLFGRNTTGGSVNFYTNDPTREFEASLSAGVDNHERYTGEGYVSGPLGENFSGRLAFMIRGSDGGPWDNLFNGEEIGKQDDQQVRGKLLWEGDSTNVMLTIQAGKDNGDQIPYKGPGILVDLTDPANAGQFNCPETFTGAVTENPATCLKFGGLATALLGRPDAEVEPNDIFTVNQDYWPTKRHEFIGGNIRIEHDLDWATLTSITAYQYFEREEREDSDAAVLISTNTNWYNQIDQFSQELRLAGSLADENWRYVLGLYYNNDDIEEVDGSDLSGHPLGIAPPFAPYFYTDFTQEVDSFAVFLHNEYDFTEKLTLNIGARASWDYIDFDALTALSLNDQTGKKDITTPCLITTFNSNGDRLAPGCAGLAAIIPLPVDTIDGSTFRGSRADNDFSFRVGFDYNYTDDLLIYANYSTAYRSGGFTAPFAGLVTEFDPEEMSAIEGGFKSQLLNNTLQVNAAVYMYQYDELQVNVDDVLSPLVPITRNIGKSVTKGIEAEALWVPSENWAVKGGISYLDSEFKRTTRSIATYFGPIPLEGKRPVNTPEWTFNGLVRYERPLFDGWNVILMTDFRWTDDRFLEATNQVFDKADDYWIVNARGAIASQDGKWEVAVWGKNIFDEEYLNYINNIAFFKLDIFSEPASYGATITYRYQ